MQVEQDYYTYKPQSDFLVLKFNLPRLGLAVAVNPPDSISDMGHHRLILQGASIVRFANSSLEAYKEDKNFIFMAVFVCDDGQADRYLIYQIKGSDAVRTHVLKKTPMLNYRRYIARENSSTSQNKITALNLCSNCTISLPNCRMRMRTKTHDKRSGSSQRV